MCQKKFLSNEPKLRTWFHDCFTIWRLVPPRKRVSSFPVSVAPFVRSRSCLHVCFAALSHKCDVCHLTGAMCAYLYFAIDNLSFDIYDLILTSGTYITTDVFNSFMLFLISCLASFSSNVASDCVLCVSSCSGRGCTGGFVFISSWSCIRFVLKIWLVCHSVVVDNVTFESLHQFGLFLRDFEENQEQCGVRLPVLESSQSKLSTNARIFPSSCGMTREWLFSCGHPS